jgi:uroporphyrin-III C-methyltransferase/precorrin-2 dehydrogenase/sirohydrochlorin ferrochelatase
VASSVAFATARGRGGARADLARLAGAADTLVVLMALEGLAQTAETLAQVVGAARPAAMVAAAGTRRQRVVRGDVGTIADACATAGLEPPATLIVGEVVAAAAARPVSAAAG